MALDGAEGSSGELDESSLLAMDALMACWSRWDLHAQYYLTTLAAQIAAGGVPANANANEREAVSRLRDLLAPQQWANLPGLLTARREQLAREQDERAQAELDTELEQLRLAAERERAERSAQVEREKAGRLRERAVVELGPLVERQLQENFLTVDAWMGSQELAPCLPEGWLQTRKVDFVQRWARQNLDADLDVEQALAVASVGHLRVTARAGSGKTRTLVTRAAFLMRHCRVPADAVLLVAFNVAAAREMTDRLRQMLPEGHPLPFSMTFHALAHALVHPEEELLGDTDQRPVLSDLVQSLINRMMSEPRGARQVQAAMFQYFSAEWAALDRRGIGEGQEAYFRRQLDSLLETFSGDFVKSYGEKLISNTLFRNDVTFRYEYAFRWDGLVYRPDFTIFRDGKPVAIVEYFGRTGDEDYDAQSADKRRFWSRRPETLLELGPADIAAGSERCSQWVLDRLDELGVAHRELTDDEVWELAQRRGVDRFSKAVNGFIGRARQNDISPEILADKLRHHVPVDAAEAAFLDLAAPLYADYIQELRRRGADDFTGLMWRAVRQLESGSSTFTRDRGRESGDIARLRHVHVDEFQDFSTMFNALLHEVVRISGADVFAVGDDWQAINGFAGADLSYFDSFPVQFADASQLNISSNYRSPAGVVAIGNEIMRGRGVLARSPGRAEGETLMADPASDTTSSRSNRFSGDVTTPAVLRLLLREINAGVGDIAILLRRKEPWRVHDAEARKVPSTLEGLQAYLLAQLPEAADLKLTISTVHKFKGREADTVIIADAHAWAYPLLHPAWSFTRIFGDEQERLLEEERRLFYVASTRPRQTLIYLVDGTPSPFLADERIRKLLVKQSLDRCPPIPVVSSDHVEIRVSNCYESKDRLKQLGFRWSPAMRVWHKRVARGDADVVRLREEASLLPGAGVELVDLAGTAGTHGY